MAIGPAEHVIVGFPEGNSEERRPLRSPTLWITRTEVVNAIEAVAE
jgi:hypothetical protein